MKSSKGSLFLLLSWLPLVGCSPQMLDMEVASVPVETYPAAYPRWDPRPVFVKADSPYFMSVDRQENRVRVSVLSVGDGFRLQGKYEWTPSHRAAKVGFADPVACWDGRVCVLVLDNFGDAAVIEFSLDGGARNIWTGRVSMMASLGFLAARDTLAVVEQRRITSVDRSGKAEEVPIDVRLSHAAVLDSGLVITRGNDVVAFPEGRQIRSYGPWPTDRVRQLAASSSTLLSIVARRFGSGEMLEVIDLTSHDRVVNTFALPPGSWRIRGIGEKVALWNVDTGRLFVFEDGAGSELSWTPPEGASYFWVCPSFSSDAIYVAFDGGYSVLGVGPAS